MKTFSLSRDGRDRRTAPPAFRRFGDRTSSAFSYANCPGS
jgi:hypothetical protein